MPGSQYMRNRLSLTLRISSIGSIALAAAIAAGCSGETPAEPDYQAQARAYQSEARALCKEWEAEDRELVQPAAEAAEAVSAAVEREPQSSRAALEAYFREFSLSLDLFFDAVSEKYEGQVVLNEEISGLEAPSNRQKEVARLSAAIDRFDRLWERRVRPGWEEVGRLARDTATELERAEGLSEFEPIANRFERAFDEISLEPGGSRLDKAEQEMFDEFRKSNLTSCADAFDRSTKRWEGLLDQLDS